MRLMHLEIATGRAFPASAPREYLLVASILAMIIWSFHIDAMQGFWRADDGAHLKFAVDYSPWQYFFDPVVTKGQSGANLTPWNVFFYDVNLTLFEFSPRWHYAHQLLALMGTAVALYLVLKQWLPMAQSLVGACAFLLGKPTVYVAQHLMTGHYVEGLLFSLLAILAWNQAVRTGSKLSLTIAAFLYLVAASCKEVYVPLPLVLIALPIGTLRRRLGLIWPFVLVTILYAGWRFKVLGSLVGGYDAGTGGLNPSDLLSQFASIPRLLAGEGLIGTCGLLIFLATLLHSAAKRRLDILLITTMAAVLLLPLVPLIAFPGIHSPDRYLFAIWAALSAAIAAILPRQDRPHAAIAIGFVLLTIMGIGAIREEARLSPGLYRDDTLYRFALNLDPSRQGIFVPGDDGYWSLVLSAIRHAHSKFNSRAETLPVSIAGDSPISLAMFTSSDLEGKRFYRYQDGSMQVADIHELRQIAMARSRNGGEKPLNVAIRYKDGAIHWNFGPYPGRYMFAVVGVGTVRLPRTGSYPWEPDQLFRVRTCYESDHEWIRCSPWLAMNPREEPTLIWNGSVGPPP